MPAKRKSDPAQAAHKKLKSDSKEVSSSEKTKARLGSQRSRRLYEALAQIIALLPYDVLILITSYDIEYRLYSLDEKGMMCVWSYEEGAKRMEYVASETRSPAPFEIEDPANKIVVCTGGYVVARSTDGLAPGDFNLLRALPDPLHGGYSLDYRLVCVGNTANDEVMQFLDPQPMAICVLPGNRLLGALYTHEDHGVKLAVYQLHDHDDSKHGEKKDLSDLGLPNYALWDYLALRITPLDQQTKSSCHLSTVRRQHDELKLKYEALMKDCNSVDANVRYSVDANVRSTWKALLIYKMLLESSPLASNPLLPPIWSTPFPPYPETKDGIIHEPTHLLPLPAPYGHVVVCWSAPSGNLLIFNTETRRDVGSYQVQSSRDIHLSSMMLFDYLENEERFIIVTSSPKRYDFYEIVPRALQAKYESAASSSSFSSSSPSSSLASSAQASSSPTAANDGFWCHRVAAWGAETKKRGETTRGDVSAQTAVCCTRAVGELSTPFLISATEDGSLHGYKMTDIRYNFTSENIERAFGPITHKRYGVRSKRKTIATAICGLPGGRVATSGGEAEEEHGLIRVWHLDQPFSEDGVAVTSELRLPEHKGRKIIDLQISWAL